MAQFEVEVIEYLSRIVEVEADNLSDAMWEVEQMWRKGDIVLDAEDFAGHDVQPWEG